MLPQVGSVIVMYSTRLKIKTAFQITIIFAKQKHCNQILFNIICDFMLVNKMRAGMDPSIVQMKFEFVIILNFIASFCVVYSR